MNAFSHLANLSVDGSNLVRAGINDLFGIDHITDVEKQQSARCDEAPGEFLGKLVAGQTIALAKTEPPAREVTGPSILFLETVGASRFLEFAYWDLLGRDIDKDGLESYGSLDFTDMSIRRHVLDAILHSEEYAGKQRDTGGFAHMDAYRNWRDRLCLVAGETHALSLSGARGLGGGLSKQPLIWRDVMNGGEIYLCFGMTMIARCDRDSLEAPPEWVFHGPKCPIAKGLYRLRFNIAAEETDLFHFDVVHAGGTRTLLSRKFFGTQQCIEALEIPDDTIDFEVRLFNLTGRTVRIDVRELSLSLVS